MLHEQCEQIRDGHSLYQRSFLVHPTDCELMGCTLSRSTEAVLVCGHLHTEDVLFMVDGGVSRVCSI